MLKAIEAASAVKAKIALIDQDIAITLKRLSKVFTFREKMRVLKDILKFMFFRKKTMKEMGLKKINFDLRKVPSQDLIEKLMDQLKIKYPSIYEVLIDERNKLDGTIFQIEKSQKDIKDKLSVFSEFKLGRNFCKS